MSIASQTPRTSARDAATGTVGHGVAHSHGRFITAVEDALREFFAGQHRTVAALGSHYVEAVDELTGFVLRGGKRIRPTFAWNGWIGAGGDSRADYADAVLKASAALELIQACALVHDDIMDSSPTRRGSPAVHEVFAGMHRRRGWSGNAAKHGESIALLLGDLALCWADDMLRDAGLKTEDYKRISPIWSAMRTEVIGGQLLDATTCVSGDESIDAAIAVDRYKTAAYTVERPLHLGAALAAADGRLIYSYRRFGADIGIAFQLRDDILGVFGDPAVTGKPVGDDLREGKRTVLLAEALRRADAVWPRAARLIRDGIGTELNAADIERLRGAFTELGAVARVEARIDRLTTRAIEVLDASDTAPPAKDRLRKLAYSATRRPM